MASYEDIKATILKVAGNPSAGIIAELAHDWALEIEKLDSASQRLEKETRVTKPAEIR
jgi:hypothetical protein